MEKQFTDEKTGIGYTLHSDYYLPDIILQEETEIRPVGIYGQRHGRYLKKYKKNVYTELLTSGRLHTYLADIDEQAQERFELLMKQMAEKEGITEKLKADNQLLWVQKMNNISAIANEIEMAELVFC